jgi:hypothetical protein
MSDTPAAVFEQVLRTLLAEEAELAALTAVARRELDALMRSDYPAIDAASSSMLLHARDIEDLEGERRRLLATLHLEEATLGVVVLAAESAGVEGFAEARSRLLARTAELREAQERNARLLLAAMKLQERWITMFGALSSPTYGADGSQDRQLSRRIMSRSA